MATWPALEGQSMTNGTQTLSLIGPAIMLVFCTAFAGAWLIDRQRPYILGLSTACLLFALGTLTQVFGLPADKGINALLSAAWYTGAVLCASQALVLRAGVRPDWLLMIAAFVGIEIALWYFYYVDRSLITRIYIQNFAYGVILLFAALKIRKSRQNKYIDAAVFYVLAAFALHFFPRTLYFVGKHAPAGGISFLNSAFWQSLQMSLTMFGTALAVTVLIATFFDIIADLRRERDMDGLTGLLNRRGFTERAQAALKNAQGPMSLIVADIDRFKQINDRFGHAGGDIALRDVASLLSHIAAKDALVGRLGGEEFAILLTGHDTQAAFEQSEQMRKAIAHHQFAMVPGLDRVTTSLGVAELKPSDTWDSLLRRADECLYAAKNNGRNRTIAKETVRVAKLYTVS